MLRQATQNLITALYPRLSHEDELQGESNEASATFEQNRIWALNRLKEIFHDEDNNLERWMKGDRCIFRMNHSEQPMSVNIGKDTEALYNFLCFCYKLNTNQRISDEFRDYLALSITRSCSDCWEEC